MLKVFKKLFIASIFMVVVISFSLFANNTEASLIDSLSGRILLQVEDNGEAWYLHPVNNKRYFLGRPADAFRVMREQGIGISNYNLSKIEVSLDNLSGLDSDTDGLPDSLEIALGTLLNNSDTDGDGFSDFNELLTGYNPLGVNKLSYDQNFSKAQAGKIFLQVEKNGEAWYVNPVNNKRYFLGRPADAFSIMRRLGLGITNANLAKIPVFSSLKPLAVECSSWAYSDWGDCLANGQKTRSIISSFPAGCMGGKPILSGACASGSKDFVCGDSIFYEGQEYPSTKIGDQCWLARNLNVGTMINNTEQQSNNNIIEKYCGQNDKANCDIFGGLYQWSETVQYDSNVTNISGHSSYKKVQGICPSGWHIPSNNEWSFLEQHLATDTCGSNELDWQCYPTGKRLKSSRTALGPDGEKVGIATDEQPKWYYDANNYGIDDLGFSAFPNGMTRNGRTEFTPGHHAWFWSSTSNSSKYAWYFILESDKSTSYRARGNDYYQRTNGLAVRCLMD
ncbi:MAG: hypothetical protein EOM88_02100 [Clostridia bacterium]|nr:hypothetical protein [Clostridia bacterium]